jgi:DNA-binding NarL/FixJ family response regulator
MEFPRIRILIVSRQSELTYAERALRAGASGYWMQNGSLQELMRAIETVLRSTSLKQSLLSQCESSPAAETFHRGWVS